MNNNIPPFQAPPTAYLLPFQGISPNQATCAASREDSEILSDEDKFADDLFMDAIHGECISEALKHAYERYPDTLRTEIQKNVYLALNRNDVDKNEHNVGQNLRETFFYNYHHKDINEVELASSNTAAVIAGIAISLQEGGLEKAINNYYDAHPMAKYKTCRDYVTRLVREHKVLTAMLNNFKEKDSQTANMVEMA